MDINAAFPSKYLKCADLMGRKARVTIERVEMDTIGDDHRPVLYFRGKEKALVLNKTNANIIAEIYGNDTDGWFGKSIVLKPARVDYAGKRVDAIRVDEPDQPAAPRPMQHAIATEQQLRNGRQAAAPRYNERNPPPRDDMNDEVPF